MQTTFYPALTQLTDYRPGSRTRAARPRAEEFAERHMALPALRRRSSDEQIELVVSGASRRGRAIERRSRARALCFNSPLAMPKMKTHSGAKKRFRKTAKGKLRGRRAYSSHILEKKSPKRKRRMARPVEISTADAKRVNKLLGRQGGLSEPRSTNAVARRKRRKKTLRRRRSGYYGRKHSSYRFANEQVQRSGTYAYRDRRTRKRDFRRLWITRINAAARREGMSYSRAHARPQARPASR